MRKLKVEGRKVIEITDPEDICTRERCREIIMGKPSNTVQRTPSTSTRIWSNDKVVKSDWLK